MRVSPVSAFLACPTCPPMTPPVSDFAAAVTRYESALVVQADAPVPDNILSLFAQSAMTSDRSRVYARADFRDR